MAYTYDPSQNIKQGFQQAQAGIGDIFTHVIAQKQRDYNLAENTLQNIEALKKNLNIFGQKNITNKANDLLAKTSSAIQKNGKLDYSSLGDLRQQVSAIGDLKQGYDLGAKEYERMLQLGIANKDNLISFEKFYKELSAKMGDENLVGNPQDLQQALADTYSNNLDARAMFEKSFYKQNPLKPVSQDVRNAKGQVTGIVKGEIPSNMTIDANGKAVLVNPTVTVMGPDGQPKTLDYVDQQLQQIQQNQPDLWNQMKKQQGFGATIAGDRGVMEYYLSGVQPKLSTHETKSEAQLSSETTQAKAGELKLKNLPTEIALENQGKRANILQSEAATKNSNLNATKTQAEINALKGESNLSHNLFLTTEPVTIKDKSGKDVTRNVDAIGTPLGKPIKMSIPTNYGPKSLNVTNITRDKEGTVRVEYLEPKPSATAGSLDLSKFDTETAIANGATIKHATVSPKDLNKFMSTIIQGIRSNITDKTESAKKINDVQALFYKSGTIKGNTIYIDRSLQEQEDAIKKKYNVGNVVLI